MNIKLKWGVIILAIFIVILGIFYLFIDSEKSSRVYNENQGQVVDIHKENLSSLQIKQKSADIALPFCEKVNCIDIDILTVETQDQAFNQWVNNSQAKVIQNQIGINQEMNLQQAIDAYVRKSDKWVEQQKGNKPYSLGLYTRIAAQRNQYLLLQIGVDTDQENISIKERYYFFVCDRSNNKTLKILDVIEPSQQTTMNDFIQNHYKSWLGNQSDELQKIAPKKLLWGQAEWFFDQEGVGLHFRTDEIVKEGSQLDIYLNKAQTQQVIKPVIYKNMF